MTDPKKSAPEPQDSAKAAPQKLNAADIVRVQEVNRTVRCITICAAVLGTTKMIVDGILEGIEKLAGPAWVDFMTTVIVALAAPSGVFVTAIAMYKKYVKKTHAAQVENEKKADPQRTSSERPTS